MYFMYFMLCILLRCKWPIGPFAFNKLIDWFGPRQRYSALYHISVSLCLAVVLYNRLRFMSIGCVTEKLQLSDIVSSWLNGVYTLQTVVQPVVEPAVKCIRTFRYRHGPAIHRLSYCSPEMIITRSRRPDTTIGQLCVCSINNFRTKWQSIAYHTERPPLSS